LLLLGARESLGEGLGIEMGPRPRPQMVVTGLVGPPRLVAQDERERRQDAHQEHELDVQGVAGHLLLLWSSGVPRTRDSGLTWATKQER